MAIRYFWSVRFREDKGESLWSAGRKALECRGYGSLPRRLYEAAILGGAFRRACSRARESVGEERKGSDEFGQSQGRRFSRRRLENVRRFRTDLMFV